MSSDSDVTQKEQEGLLRQATAGDAIALQTLLHFHRVRLLRYIDRRLPSELASVIDAEDILQDVCVEAFRHLGQLTLDNCEAFGRWLLTVARHRMGMLLRAVKSQKRGGAFRRMAPSGEENEGGVLALLESLALYLRTPSQSAAAHEMAVAVQRSISDLPQHYRQAIQLHHLDGLSPREAALAMHRTEGAFHQIRRRALEQLRSSMRSKSSVYI
jgi:RNA polymerase sigma factor (sigma-70 family)